MSKNYTVNDLIKGVADTIKSQLTDYEASLIASRKKELQREHGNLNKSELCLLCAGPEFKCGCTLAKAALDKNDFVTGKRHINSPDAKVSFGSKVHSKDGTDSSMATSPKDEPASYGSSPFQPKSTPKTINITKNELAKKTPPDISEKTMHKLKDEYGHDEKGKEKAYATAWSIENKMKKDELGGEPSSMMMTEKGEICKSCGKKGDLCKCMGKKEISPGKAENYSEEANGGATKTMKEPGVAAKDNGSVTPEPGEGSSKAPKVPKAENYSDQANGTVDKKGKGGKLDKAAMASSSASALAPKPEHVTPVGHVNNEMKGFKSIASKPPIASMGRPKAAVSGSINAMKSEGKPEDPKGLDPIDVGKWHVTKDRRLPERGYRPGDKNAMKSEVKTNPDKDVDDSGSGNMPGKKMPKEGLTKGMLPSTKHPEAQGMVGKQPPGMGGGDAGGPKAPGLASASGLSSAGQWKQQGLPQLQASLQAVRGGGGWLKSTHAGAARIHPAKAAPASQRFHGATPLQRNEKDSNK